MKRLMTVSALALILAAPAAYAQGQIAKPGDNPALNDQVNGTLEDNSVKRFSKPGDNPDQTTVIESQDISSSDGTPKPGDAPNDQDTTTD